MAGLVARQTPAGVSPRLIEQVGSGGRDGRKAASCGASAFGQLDQRVDHALVGLAHGREGGARGGQVAVVQNVREGGGGLVQVRERKVACHAFQRMRLVIGGFGIALPEGGRKAFEMGIVYVLLQASRSYSAAFPPKRSMAPA